MAELQINQVASSGETGVRLIDAVFLRIASAAGFELMRGLILGGQYE